MIDELFPYNKFASNSILIAQILLSFGPLNDTAIIIMFLIVSLSSLKRISSSVGASRLPIGTDPKSIGGEDDLQTKQSLERISFVDEKSFGNEGKEGDSIVSNSRFIQAINQLWRGQQLATDTNRRYTFAHMKEKGRGLIKRSMQIKF
ncbi:hypothetical protein ONS95_005004 [Cadophora gregata]|uniref:uncharacterized protein n=1 Tax=Cadophora gregata TaxID=51156 RepID=UPI0026DB9281|nr:uncharacterized protein ONS95_005004 [Cadophora gregata]KAK0104733.1 hypothetical protein ONS95_005004 [Cadophora gregata]KAK0115185.1 hypothetical protein ONS96_013651 [Cadophora gregata f. sp. sojae]